MATYFRKIPPICLVISLLRILTGSLRYSKKYLHDIVKMEDGQEFTVFRHISTYPLRNSETATVFIVSFKFAHLSHKSNKLASIIPMLLISGFLGFVTKIYTVNYKNGYWQGMYQWRSKQALEEYKKSFVFRMMNKRAIDNTLHSVEFENRKLEDYVEEMTKDNFRNSTF